MVSEEVMRQAQDQLQQAAIDAERAAEREDYLRSELEKVHLELYILVDTKIDSLSFSTLVTPPPMYQRHASHPNLANRSVASARPLSSRMVPRGIHVAISKSGRVSRARDGSKDRFLRPLTHTPYRRLSTPIEPSTETPTEPPTEPPIEPPA